MKKTDLRVKRTQKMIFDAFVSLVEEKGYEKITVQEISDVAMINRATFYAHFKDKQDLYDAIFQTVIDNFLEELHPETLVQGNRVNIKKIEAVFTKLYEQVRENRKLFLMIFHSSGTDAFHKKVVQTFTTTYPHVLEVLKVTESQIEIPLDLIIEFVVSIFISTIRWWVMSDMSMEPQELAHLTIKLIRNGHLKVMGLEIID